MAKQIYDVIVIGTGAGGGMAIKTLCEAGLKVCAVNAGRRLDPEKDFRYHRMPWDMKFRGLDDPKRQGESYGYMGNEYTKAAWDHEIPFTVAPGAKWMWPRCNAVGGKTNFWGRSSARFGDIDFRAASVDDEAERGGWRGDQDGRELPELVGQLGGVRGGEPAGGMAVILTGIICHHSNSAVLTTSLRPAATRWEYHTCPIGAPNSHKRMKGIQRATFAENARPAAMSVHSSRHPIFFFRRPTRRRISSCAPMLWP